MSLEATQLVWARSPLRGSPLLVHLRIADVVNADHGYEFWQSNGRTAREARVSRSTVVNAMAALVEHGWLKVVARYPGEGRPTRYRFVLGVAAADATCALTGLDRPDVGLDRALTGHNTEEQKEHFSRALIGLDPAPPEPVPLFDSGPAVPPPWREQGITYAEWLGGSDERTG